MNSGLCIKSFAWITPLAMTVASAVRTVGTEASAMQKETAASALQDGLVSSAMKPVPKAPLGRSATKSASVRMEDRVMESQGHAAALLELVENSVKMVVQKDSMEKAAPDDVVVLAMATVTVSMGPVCATLVCTAASAICHVPSGPLDLVAP